jgi:xylulokinase
MTVNSDLLLGIDIGTQGVKGILVTPRGQVLAEQLLEQSCVYPHPGWAEHDMLQNWQRNPQAVIRRLLQTEGVRPEQVKGVFVDGLHPNFGPTDAKGRPLRNAILYSDNRAVEELEQINRDFGLKLTSEELTPKLVWFLRREPELAARLAMIFDAAHYFIYCLTGAYVTDTISVGGWGAIYHSPSASWKPDACDHLGIPLDGLPRVHPPLDIVGEVTRQAAEETGLKAGTPVMAGTNDVTASTISTGAVHTSEAAVYYGTAGLLPVMKMDMEHAVRLPYPVEERGERPQDGYLFDYPAYCLTTGDGVRWFRDEFGRMEHLAEQAEGGPSAYARFDRLAEATPPGAEGLLFLPYLLGQRSPEFNPHASGAFFGIRRQHTRGHFFRAILESWGLTIRYGLETYYPQGHPLQRLIATGGGAKSRLWRQIVCDISGLPQEYVPNAEGALADAYLAGMALGWFKDFSTFQQEWIQVSEVIQPDPATHRFYSSEVYPQYVKLHRLIRSNQL